MIYVFNFLLPNRDPLAFFFLEGLLCDSDTLRLALHGWSCQRILLTMKICLFLCNLSVSQMYRFLPWQTRALWRPLLVWWATSHRQACNEDGGAQVNRFLFVLMGQWATGSCQFCCKCYIGRCGY